MVFYIILFISPFFFNDINDGIVITNTNFHNLRNLCFNTIEQLNEESIDININIVINIRFGFNLYLIIPIIIDQKLELNILYKNDTMNIDIVYPKYIKKFQKFYSDHVKDRIDQILSFYSNHFTQHKRRQLILQQDNYIYNASKIY